MEPILEVKGLSVAFQQYDAGTRQRRLPVIRDLSLSIGAGPTAFWESSPTTPRWRGRSAMTASA